VLIPASRPIAVAELEWIETSCLELTIYSDEGREKSSHVDIYIYIYLHQILRQQFFRSATSVTEVQNMILPRSSYGLSILVLCLQWWVRFAPLASQNRSIPPDFSQIQDTHTA